MLPPLGREKTTAEIFESLKSKDLKAEARNKLKQLLSLADLVKFAKERPAPTENEQSIEDAIDFVKLTREESFFRNSVMVALFNRSFDAVSSAIPFTLPVFWAVTVE